MQIKFSRDFRKQFQKADLKIRKTFERKLELFKENPFRPQLNNHSLKGKLSGFRSINITGDWRALYSEYKNGEMIVVFELIGQPPTCQVGEGVKVGS